jgi:hypothetical protein
MLCFCERSEAIAPIELRRAGAMASLRSQEQTIQRALITLGVQFVLFWAVAF